MTTASIAPPASADLAEWLASVPFTEPLWGDLQRADVTFELAMSLTLDALKEVSYEEKLKDFWRAHEALELYLDALGEVISRSWTRDVAPLAPLDARSFSDGIRLDVFLESPSGAHFLEWHQNTND